MKLDVSKVELSCFDRKRGIKIPTELTEDLAYLIGVHIADGSMNVYRRKHAVDYPYKCSGHPINDKEYYKSVLKPLFKQVFNFDLKCFYGADGCIFLKFNSKAFVTFCNKAIGLPLGKKSDIIKIPEVILRAPLAVKIACVKGIFDTDFCLNFKNKNGKAHDYPVIKISVRSPFLIEDIANILDGLDFNYSKYRYNQFDARIGKRIESFAISISGKKNLNKWFEIIGSRSPNNLTKFGLWERTGECPPWTNVLERQKQLESL